MWVVVYDNCFDVFVSLGVFIGIIGVVFGVFWFDFVMVFLVGILIVYIVIKIFYDVVYILIDGFDVFKFEIIYDLIVFVFDVKKVIDIKVWMNGNKIWIDVIIVVDFELNVVKSYVIIEIVE